MRWAVWIVVAALGLAGGAQAQDFPTILPNDYVLKDILNQQRIDSSIGGARSQPAPAARPAPASRSVTTYVSRPEISAKARKQFIDWFGAQAGGDGGRRMAQALSQGDPVKSWAGIVAQDGLKPGDLADVFAGYWILNWAMANSSDSTRPTALAVREQVRPILAGNPAFARLTEAQRQEMAETLMLNFLVQHAAYLGAMQKGDQATAARLGDAAVARFRNEMGVDLRRLSLTERGFVRR